MTDTEKLQKIIEKAVRNGYNAHDYIVGEFMNTAEVNGYFLFNKDFAKIFFGDEDVCAKCGNNFSKNGRFNCFC